MPSNDDRLRQPHIANKAALPGGIRSIPRRLFLLTRRYRGQRGEGDEAAAVLPLPLATLLQRGGHFQISLGAGTRRGQRGKASIVCADACRSACHAAIQL